MSPYTLDKQSSSGIIRYMEIDKGKKLYSLCEIYWLTFDGMRTVPYLTAAKKDGSLSQDSIERIMLAVTEVNGCVICSYAHTKMALEAGMTNEEISDMLSGSMSGVPKDDLPAVLFGQHYADTRGRPSTEAWNRIVDIYGDRKAKGILSAVRMIMMGNALGIPWGSFINRFKGKPDPRCSLCYELAVMLPGSLMMLPAVLHGWGAFLFKKKIV